LTVSAICGGLAILAGKIRRNSPLRINGENSDGNPHHNHTYACIATDDDESIGISGGFATPPHTIPCTTGQTLWTSRIPIVADP
jgi:hypothetical protein